MWPLCEEMCVSRGDLTRGQRLTPDSRELHEDWLPNSFYAEPLGSWAVGCVAATSFASQHRQRASGVLQKFCREQLPDTSHPLPGHPRRGTAGPAEAGGRGGQDSDLGKGNELMKSHLGGKRGI